MSKNNNREESAITKWIITGVAVVVLLVLGCCSLYNIAPGHRGVMVVLGKVEPVSYRNGVGFKWPFISSMYEMDVRTKAMTDSTSSYTSDVQTAQLIYTLTYELCPDNVHVLYEKVGTDYETKKIIPVLNDVFKDVIGKWQAQDLVSNRDKAKEAILMNLRTHLDRNFFQNVGFQIIDIDYSDKFESAIEDKVIAEQKAQEAANNTKRIKEEAEQKVITAKAEAEAMDIKAQALAKNKGLTEYEAVLKWDGKLPQYMFGNSVPMVNLNGK